jgi:hypothetical protein
MSIDDFIGYNIYHNTVAFVYVLPAVDVLSYLQHWNYVWKENWTVMDNNSTNINKMNNLLWPSLAEHKKDYHLWR